MFTGIVQEIGEIGASSRARRAARRRPRMVVVFRGPSTRDALALGDSICVDGVCLTVAALDGDELSPPMCRAKPCASRRWVRKHAGARVNLEPALRAGDSLGGHWVSGHVDGVAEVLHTARRRALAAR